MTAGGTLRSGVQKVILFFREQWRTPRKVVDLAGKMKGKPPHAVSDWGSDGVSGEFRKNNIQEN